MPVAPRETVLCRYRYDPLDRLVDCAPSAESGIQRFYCKSRLATEIQGAVRRSVFQHDNQLLAQLRREGVKVDATLLATDQQRSVLNVLDANWLHPLAYTPYGHRPAENGLLSLLGFNGERPDPVTGHYLLGNGYRGFNPVLMRFNSPDSLSPFGEGGLNAYAYCGGDPRNRMDPSGHMWGGFKVLRKFFSRLFSMKPKAPKNTPGATAQPGVVAKLTGPGTINPTPKSVKTSPRQQSLVTPMASMQQPPSMTPTPSRQTTTSSTLKNARYPTKRDNGAYENFLIKVKDSAPEAPLDKLLLYNERLITRAGPSRLTELNRSARELVLANIDIRLNGL
ncbi:RHS repeat-associated core domain-containing protein [Pseudomonas viridiflava]